MRIKNTSDLKKYFFEVWGVLDIKTSSFIKSGRKFFGAFSFNNVDVVCVDNLCLTTALVLGKYT